MMAPGERPSLSATPLASARLALTPITAADADGLFPVLDDPGLGTFTGETPPADVESLRRRFEAWSEGGSSDGTERWLNWAVSRREDGETIGHLQATVREDHAEVAWVIGTAFQGRGFASEAASAVAAWLRTVAGVSPIRANIHPGNVGSQRVASRIGLHPTARWSDGELVWSDETS